MIIDKEPALKDWPTQQAAYVWDDL